MAYPVNVLLILFLALCFFCFLFYSFQVYCTLFVHFTFALEFIFLNTVKSPDGTLLRVILVYAIEVLHYKFAVFIP